MEIWVFVCMCVDRLGWGGMGLIFIVEKRGLHVIREMGMWARRQRCSVGLCVSLEISVSVCCEHMERLGCVCGYVLRETGVCLEGETYICVCIEVKMMDEGRDRVNMCQCVCMCGQLSVCGC